MSQTSQQSTRRVKSCLLSPVLQRLPPTGDALSFHIQRAHYQTAVWRQANEQYPDLPEPETMGWRMEGASLVPTLMFLPPVPDSCMELITCNCAKRCMSARCKCKNPTCVILQHASVEHPMTIVAMSKPNNNTA